MFDFFSFFFGPSLSSYESFGSLFSGEKGETRHNKVMGVIWTLGSSIFLIKPVYGLDVELNNKKGYI
jgi:hypothetical protein